MGCQYSINEPMIPCQVQSCLSTQWQNHIIILWEKDSDRIGSFLSHLSRHIHEENLTQEVVLVRVRHPEAAQLVAVNIDCNGFLRGGQLDTLERRLAGGPHSGKSLRAAVLGDIDLQLVAKQV